MEWWVPGTVRKCYSTACQIVVLLDESEVFLEERSETDLQRNALVSVFLRAMEYYDGILILTSNRGKTLAIDESGTLSG